MSKEYLEAWNFIKDQMPHFTFSDLIEEMAKNSRIVEEALQELQAIKNAKPSGALEYFRVIKFKTINAGYDYGYKVWDKIEQALLKAQEQEKELKELKVKYADTLINNEFIKYTDNNENILNIIKQKNVDISSLKQALSVKQYNDFISFKIDYMDYMKLTEEEFELLKEYFKYE